MTVRDVCDGDIPTGKAGFADHLPITKNALLLLLLLLFVVAVAAAAQRTEWS